MKQLKEYLQNKEEFVIIKPGFLELYNEVIEFLKEHGMIVKMEERKTLARSTAKLLYKMHKDQPFYKDLVEYMCSGDSIGLILVNFKGEDMNKLKDQLRDLYGKDEMRNCIHSSDSQENEYRESKIYFSTPKLRP